MQASGRDPELGVGEILERSAQSRAASRAVPRFLRVVVEMECVSVCGACDSNITLTRERAAAAS